MKAYSLITITLFIAASMVVMIGCKYDVADPLWDKPIQTPVTPAITGINPADSAGAGVNYITIQGTNFAVGSDNFVYFGDYIAENKQSSAGSIIVYRPNYVSDSCMIRVSSQSAWWISNSYGPYKISSVFIRFGGFSDNIQLGAVAVDNLENLYVFSGEPPYTLWKVTPDGQKSIITLLGSVLQRIPYDIRLKGDTLIWMMNSSSRDILQVDLTTGNYSRWIQFQGAKTGKFGDFGPTGYFYTGGIVSNSSTDLLIVAPNPPSTRTPYKTANAYMTEEILAVRVYQNYVYVASRQINTSEPAKIYKHEIIADTVGLRDLVLDLANTPFSSRLVRGIAFSTTDKMFITTASEDPLLVFDLQTNTLDYFYKNILPPNGMQCGWGSGNYLYMISNDPTADNSMKWNIIRIDMGTTGIP